MIRDTGDDNMEASTINKAEWVVSEMNQNLSNIYRGAGVVGLISIKPHVLSSFLRRVLLVDRLAEHAPN